jgi:phage-Barnase-EndoU-ColicinE5/D-RelE like nuclease3
MSIPKRSRQCARNCGDQFERALVLEPRASDYVTIGNVSADGAARINIALKDAGHDVDVTGFQHTVTAFGSRHVLNRHGIQTRDPLPVTADDWARIPDILAAPDSITGSMTKLRLPGVIYEKRINGYIVYVEEVRTGRKTLTATTMYKRKARDDE